MDNLVSLIDILYLIIDQFSIIRARHFYLARKLLFCIENLFDNFYSIIFLFFFFTFTRNLRTQKIIIIWITRDGVTSFDKFIKNIFSDLSLCYIKKTE